MSVVNSATIGHSPDLSPFPKPAAVPLVSTVLHANDAPCDPREVRDDSLPVDQALRAPCDQGPAAVPIRHPGCCITCVFDGETEWHHGRLTAIEYDHDALLELMELALTWLELEYGQTATISPDHWMAFVESHAWTDPDRVERIFSVATAIVMRARRASRIPEARGQIRSHHLRAVDAAAPVTSSDWSLA
jgi:hypothetical protein